MVEHRDTDKKQKFVEAFADARENGVPEKEALQLALLEAGYSETTRLSVVLKGLGDEFIQYGDMKLKLKIPTAVNAIESVFDNPDDRGNPNRLAAAASVLDRAGVLKKEAKEVTVQMPSGIAFMPAKVPVDFTEASE